MKYPTITFEQSAWESIEGYPTLYKDIRTFKEQMEESRTRSKLPDKLLEPGFDFTEWFESCRRDEEAELKARPLSSYSQVDLTHMGQRVASHIFCVIGNGYCWYPEGFSASWDYHKYPRIGSRTEDFDRGMVLKQQYLKRVFKDIPEFTSIGKFDKRYSWYPISTDYSDLLTISGMAKNHPTHGCLPEKFGFSWIRMAYNVAQSIANHGGDFGQHSRPEEEYVQLAKDCLVGLEGRCTPEEWVAIERYWDERPTAGKLDLS